VIGVVGVIGVAGVVGVVHGTTNILPVYNPAR
jgi:hypothetical protein